MSWTGFTTELTNTVEHLARIVDEIDPEPKSTTAVELQPKRRVFDSCS